MDRARTDPQALPSPVRITNRDGKGPFVFICDHASNFVPDEFAGLGLDRAELTRHIAWDPGAAPVAQRMAAALDAVLIEARISRLVIDCNRALDAPDLIPAVSETTPIPGNARLTETERSRRIALAYQPFHAAVEAVLAARLAAGRETRVVSVHSFTPVYKRGVRPWQIGILHDEDRRLAKPLIDALSRLAGIVVGVNQPYSPADGVYFTLASHAGARGLPCAMIEIRNDEISATSGQRKWADLLTGIFLDLEPGLGPAKTNAPAADEAVAPAN
jgi:predicted N-formylglutamate amidohydrolase